jgi:peptidoglycan/LPS O-acetylase OafA/YrhL
VLTNGRSAVIMFFVLSGFVLTLPALAGKNQAYPIYAVRRICRIYVPYVAALGVALVACWRFHGLQMYGNEFHMMWRSAPRVHTIAQHLIFLGRFNVYAYNPAVWSLVHEMRISLIFPLLCFVSLRLRAWAGCLIAAALPLVAAMVANLSKPYPGAGDPGTNSLVWWNTLGYCGLFLLGSILARHHETMKYRFAKIPSLLKWVLLGVSCGLYQYSMQLHIPIYLRDFAIGIGCAYVIVLALIQRGKLSRMLQLKPLRFLGRISYSLYLLHLPILMTLSIMIYRRLPYGYLLLPFLAILLVLATVFQRLIEEPSICLGKVVGRMPIWRGISSHAKRSKQGALHGLERAANRLDDRALRRVVVNRR